MDKLRNFLYGIGASNELLHSAFEKKCFIEMICLAANQIDALLRIAIILERQLRNDCRDLIDELLYQGEGDKIVMEKKIYELSLKEGIICEELRDKLYSLYNDRNRVVHRYIISDITTADVEEIARNLVLVRDEIKEIVRNIEDKQIATGRGMTSNESTLSPEELRELIEKSISVKHGKVDLDIPPANGESNTSRYYNL